MTSRPSSSTRRGTIDKQDGSRSGQRQSVFDKKAFIEKKLLLQDFSLKFTSLKAWFFRASWNVKFQYISDLMTVVDDVHVLQKVLKQVDSKNFKDYRCLKSQNIHGPSRDMIPQDNCRTLDEISLEDAMTKDKVWFSGQPSDKQILILNGLLSIGGCALKRKIHEEIEIPATNTYKGSRVIAAFSNKFDDSQPNSDPDVSLEEYEAIQDPTWMEYFTQLREIDDDDDESREAYEVTEQDETGTTETTLQNMTSQWKTAVSKLCSEFGLKDPFKPPPKNPEKRTTTSKKQSAEVTFDAIQLLPEKINRLIFSYLPKEILTVVKNVNPYWAYMVDGILKERETRNKLNEYAKHNQISVQEDDKENIDEMSNEERNNKSKYLPEEPNIRGREEIIVLMKLFRQPQWKNFFAQQPLRISISQEFLHTRVIACNPEGTMIGVSTSKWSVAFYDVDSKTLTDDCHVGHLDVITCMCFSPKGRYLITGSADKTIRCWDIQKRNKSKVFCGHEESITSVSAGGNYVLSGSLDKTVKIFNMSSEQCEETFTDEHTVTCVSLQTSVNMFYSGCSNGDIRIYNLAKKEVIQEIKAHSGRVNALFAKPAILITCGNDEMIRLWNGIKPSSQCLLAIKNCSPVNCIYLHGIHIFSGDKFGHLHIWNVVTGKCVRKIITGAITLPINNLWVLEKEDQIKVIASAENRFEMINFYSPKQETLSIYGPPHRVCCTNFFETKEIEDKPFGISQSEFRLMALEKRRCVHQKLRAEDSQDLVFKSVLTNALCERPNIFQEPAKLLQPFKRSQCFKTDSPALDEFYKTHNLTNSGPSMEILKN